MIINLCPQINVYRQHQNKSPHLRNQQNISSNIKFNFRHRKIKPGINITIKSGCIKLQNKQLEKKYITAVKNVATQTNLENNQKQIYFSSAQNLTQTNNFQLNSPKQKYKICNSILEGQTKTSQISLSPKSYFPYLPTSLYQQNNFNIISKLNQRLDSVGENLKTIQSMDSSNFIVSNDNRKLLMEESIIQTKNVLENFKIIKKLQISELYEQDVAVQKNIGYFLILKRINNYHLKEISNQIIIHKQLNYHPNILYFIQSITHNQQYLLIYQYYQYSLKHKVGKLSEQQIFYYIQDILQALQYLHTKNIVYNDFTAENIKIINGVCKLGNLGICKKIKKSEYELNPWISHDIILKQQNYGSLGNLLLEILEIKSIFIFKDNKFSRQMVNFIKFLLKNQIKDIKEIKKHKWITQTKYNLN